MTALGIGFSYWYLSDDTYVYDYDGPVDYELLRNEIRSYMYSSEFDDGCCAPLLLRLAFNQAATYSRYDGLGGMNGATLRFEPQLSFPHNAGLKRAMQILEPIKQQYGDQLSYADLWTLASYVAIEEMGGPYIDFVPGRVDYVKDKVNPNNPDAIDYKLDLVPERFPEWDCGVSRLIDWWDRMDLSDREGVALMGAHSCGRLHAENCGLDASWSDAQILSNEYYRNFQTVPYVYERRGTEHYFDPSNPELVLLPIEGSFFYNARTMRWGEFYAYADLHIWLNDFAATFKKITELGCDLSAAQDVSGKPLKLYNLAGGS
eukprot:CAMPEP_0197052490 /NCGR_PEP_ID=MMETSP1384-20130603/26967_1 /TAXON_ID=29189 /ORGANISM="Ammonia sp." /LENGTH=317 /DNA_ID=CAMNT_0042485239 /DNA_START=204 /DNA_END=1157 /DNA_ORIENTATION=-